MMKLLFESAGLIGLLFFFSVFSFIILWAFKPSKKNIIESYKYIPLLEKNDEIK